MSLHVVVHHALANSKYFLATELKNSVREYEAKFIEEHQRRVSECLLDTAYLETAILSITAIKPREISHQE